MTTFLCYADRDSDSALTLHRALVEQRCVLWIDKLDIEPGSNWQASIEAAIAQCDQLVVLVSEHSTKSQEVAAEWNLALELGKLIIPVLLDDTPLPFRLRAYQAVDLCRLGLDAALTRLRTVLPTAATPRHLEMPDGGAVNINPKEFTTVRIGRYPHGDRIILVDPTAYSTLASILDELFINYLHPTIKPYTYGSDWMLIGEPFDTHLAVPSDWVRAPGQPVSKLAPTWPDTIRPADIAFRRGTYWKLGRFVQTEGYTWQRPITDAYVIASNDERLVMLLLSDAKVISLMLKEQVLVSREPSDIDPNTFRFRLVFHDWLGLGLRGLVVTESGMALPPRIEEFVARRLRP
ncbi:MAG TPA: toll/interleukin-1 receptor domain-containing protein [Thermoanaerobaculia bacterium]|nr:toll/interleukin-1 receptor domain-containing protein [Thermoanaerobaculia bacterium]